MCNYKKINKGIMCWKLKYFGAPDQLNQWSMWLLILKSWTPVPHWVWRLLEKKKKKKRKDFVYLHERERAQVGRGRDALLSTEPHEGLDPRSPGIMTWIRCPPHSFLHNSILSPLNINYFELILCSQNNISR